MSKAAHKAINYLTREGSLLGTLPSVISILQDDLNFSKGSTGNAPPGVGILATSHYGWRSSIAEHKRRGEWPDTSEMLYIKKSHLLDIWQACDHGIKALRELKDGSVTPLSLMHQQRMKSNLIDLEMRLGLPANADHMWYSDIGAIVCLRFIKDEGNGWSPQSREAALKLDKVLGKHGFSSGDVNRYSEVKSLTKLHTELCEALSGAVQYIDTLETGKPIPPIPDMPVKKFLRGKWVLAAALGAQAAGIGHGVLTGDKVEAGLFTAAGAATAKIAHERASSDEGERKK